MEKAVLCYKADQLVASLLSFCSFQSSLAVHEFRATGEEPFRCMDGCVLISPSMPDVASPKVHQNNCSSTNLPSDSLRENLAWWVVTRRTLKTTKLSKLAGGHLHGYGRLLWTIRYYKQMGNGKYPANKDDIFPSRSLLPYSGKLSRGRSFHDFHDQMPACKNLFP